MFDGSPENRLSFSDLGWDVGLANDDPFVGVVDLGRFTSQLQSGAVNVQLNDDTAVDWAIYTITVANPIAGRSAAEVVIDGGGIALVNTAINNVDRLLVGGDVSGQLSIAASGSLAVDQLYTQLSNGVLAVEFGVTNSGLLEVAGLAALDGQLRLELEAGFSVIPGDELTVLTAAGIVGEFADIAAPDFVEGLGFRANYNADSVVIDVLLSGDYNEDGFVDAADFTVWRDSLGSTNDLAADGNNNGVIDAADLVLWQNFFGNSAADFSNFNGVPEPSSWVLALASLALVLGRIRRHEIAQRRREIAQA